MERGHSILGVISSDSLLAEWAGEQHLPFCDSSANLLQFLNQKPFDYLFSIVNSLILSEDILNIPQRCAINYHDSPLPKYAGLYATSWALLHGETHHAISWHLLQPGIDMGGILKQVPIAIEPRDTAFLLNAKCFEAGITSFANLIDELATASLVAVPQDLSHRSYFSRSRKPARGLQFHWQRSAQDLVQLVRALDFGPFPNPLGLPNLIIGHGETQAVVIVSQLEVLNCSSPARPGTLVAIATNALQITTSTTDVLLQELLTLQGQPIGIPELVAKLGLKVGDHLPEMSATLAQTIDQFDAQIAQYEPHWVSQLAQWAPLELPAQLRLPISARPTSAMVAALPAPLPAALQTAITQQYPNWAIGDVVLAAVVIYLGRICNQTSFDIGFQYPALTKSLQGIEPFFATQVPWRVNLDWHQSFRMALPQIIQQQQELQQYKTYTSNLIARYRELATKTTQPFDSPFPLSIHQIDTADSFTLAATSKVQQRHLGQHLTLTISRDGQLCNWGYHPDVLSQAQVEGMAAQFLAFMQDLLTQPDTDLASLPVSPYHPPAMPAVARHRLLVEWNATQVDYPRHWRIHDLFEAQAQQAPDAIAVVFDGQSLTYGELNRRSNQLAHYLQLFRVQPEVCVGVCLERSLELVVALMAILKAGGAYVPLDPTYPPDRLVHIATDAQLAVVLTQEKLLPVLSSSTMPTLCLDTLGDILATTPDTNPCSSVTSTNLAYIIYTSGSTGKPKGVLIEHGGVVNTILDINRRFAVNANDRVLAVCSLNFDLSVYDIFGLLAAGGTIVLPKPAIAPDLNHWHTLMHQEQITLWNSAPPMMQMVVNYLADANYLLPASLRLVLLSGDWIPITLPNHIRQQQQGNTPMQIISLGGATEASIWSILYLIETVDPSWTSIPYGKPMANQQFYILDEQQQLVPAGTIGELYIGGDGVARGYHNRPQLNATKFMPDPFHSAPGYRLYRTGDLGRYQADGTIEFLGRIDHQVKIRGFRVELGEIETVLSQHGGVREAAVLSRDDPTGVKQLVAYLVPNQDQCDRSNHDATTKFVNEIRRFLQAKLPGYMVPAAFVVMTSLPLTPNGKLDRQALPEPTGALNNTAPVAPRNDVERQLVAIWQEYLGVAAIGVQDNFFELGGHSLLATRLWAQIEKTFHTDLPLITLFQASTIAELANRLCQSDVTPLCPSLVIIKRGEASTAKQPLFCIHTLGRGLKDSRPLVRYLDPELTVYGLSTQIAQEGFGSNEAEDLATHYMQQIQTLQPEGPYLLLGFSFGGLVAYEIACQLTAQGQEVALLATLDSHMPKATYILPVLEQLAKFRYYFTAKPTYFLQKLLRRLSKRCVDTYLNLGSQVLTMANLPLPEAMQGYLFGVENIQAQTRYVPKRYNGVVTLFKAIGEDSFYRHTDPMLGWQEYVKQLEIHEVPGTHLAMLSEPNVKILATKLRECITRATSGHTTSNCRVSR